MLKFIKELFKKKTAEQQATTEIAAEQLSQWLEQLAEPKEKVLKEKLEETKRIVEEAKQESSAKCSALKNASLMNPDIPERAKHFMEGNREAFVKNTMQFVESIKTPDNIQGIADFITRYDLDTKGFLEKNNRPYQILQEFFANETQEIMTAVGRIEKAINTLKKALAESKIEELESAKTAVQEFRAKQKAHELFRTETEELKKELERLEKTKKELEEKKALLEKDKKLAEFRNKLAELKALAESKKTEFASKFSAIEPALRKFAKITFQHKTLAENYLASPIEALATDLKLEIARVLETLGKLAEKDELELKDRKKEKTIQAVKELSEEYLAKLQRELAELEKGIAKTQKEIEGLPAMQSIEKAQKQLDKTLTAIKDTQTKLSLATKNLEKTGVQEAKNNLEKQFSSIAKKTIRIT